MGKDSKRFKAEHNSPFNADSATIMHGRGSFVVDFKQTTPRLDKIDDSAQHTVITEHNAVVLQPQMAKVLLNLLKENIANYEETFGEIELPDTEHDMGSSSQDTHGYIG